MFESGRLVTKGFQESIGELCRVERLLGKVGDGLFDFYGVHGLPRLQFAGDFIDG